MSEDKMLVSQVEISFHIHATEDVDRVLEAVKTVLPETGGQGLEFQKQVLRGYYKNPIIQLRMAINKEAAATAILRTILKRLEDDDRALLSSALGDYIDSNRNLYLRLDKQAAYLQKIRLCTADPIHLKMRLTSLPTTLKELESALQS